MNKKRDPNYPSPTAVWLKERIPSPLLAFSVVGLPIALYMFFGSILYHRYDITAVTIFMGLLPWVLIYTNSKGAKIAWDQDRIYMRASGWSLDWRFPWVKNLPWRSLGYGEIISLDGMTLNDPAAKSVLLPFQMLRLTADVTTDDLDERHIWLYSLALRDKELAPLLRQLDARCRGKLPDVVRKRLARWADNDQEWKAAER